MAGFRVKRVQHPGSVLRGCGRDTGVPCEHHEGSLYRELLLVRENDRGYGGRVLRKIRDPHRALPEAVEAKGHALLNKYDKEAAKVTDPAESRRLLEEANREIAKMLKEETGNTLDHVLFELSNSMKNAFSRSDA